MKKLLSIREVCALTSLSRTTLWQKIRDDQFLKPISLGNGIRKAFLAEEIDAWISERIAERDEVAA
jgi:prophage regulatory protein